MAVTTFQLNARTNDAIGISATPGAARVVSSATGEMTGQGFTRVFDALDGETDITVGEKGANGKSTADKSEKPNREAAVSDSPNGEKESIDDSAEDIGTGPPLSVEMGTSIPARKEAQSSDDLTGQDRTSQSARNLPSQVADISSSFRVEAIDLDDAPPDQSRLGTIPDVQIGLMAEGSRPGASIGSGTAMPESPDGAGMNSASTPDTTLLHEFGNEDDRSFFGKNVHEPDTRDRQPVSAQAAAMDGRESKGDIGRDGASFPSRNPGLNESNSIPAYPKGDTIAAGARNTPGDFEASASGANGVSQGSPSAIALSDPGRSAFPSLPDIPERERPYDRIDAVSLPPAQRDPAFAGFSPATRPVLHASFRPDMTREMAILIHRKTDRNFDISLQPEELGHVRMSLRVDDAGISVWISADRPVAQDLMRRHADQLAANLHSLGYEGVNIEFADHGSGAPGSGAHVANRQPDAKHGAEDASGPTEVIRLLDETRLDLRI